MGRKKLNTNRTKPPIKKKKSERLKSLEGVDNIIKNNEEVDIIKGSSSKINTVSFDNLSLNDESKVVNIVDDVGKQQTALLEKNLNKETVLVQKDPKLKLTPAKIQKIKDKKDKRSSTTDLDTNDIDKLTVKEMVKKYKMTFEQTNALEMCLNQWKNYKNLNAYFFAYALMLQPMLVAPYISRTQKTKTGYYMQKSLLDRTLSKLMNYRSSSTGKKSKTKKILLRALHSVAGSITSPANATQEEKLKLASSVIPTSVLLMLLIRGVTDIDIRRQKFGSGHLTRAIRVTLFRKVSWFLKELSLIVKAKKKKSLYLALKEEFIDLYHASPKSKILAKRREAEMQADKANLQ